MAKLHGFPSRPGAGLIKATGKRKAPKRRRRARPAELLSQANARGNTVAGAALSTTRIGY